MKTDDPEVWAWIGISGDATETGHVTPVNGADLELAHPSWLTRSGSYYEFVNDHGYVADDSGQSTANGAHVIASPKSGGKNQQWSPTEKPGRPCT